ncbi:unnamed protein product [Effrenium voratum]|nr:unnamed protein product [Effrenium voratum]
MVTSQKQLPGLQSFATARSCCALLAAYQPPQDALRSRLGSEPGEGIEELSEELQHVLSLEEFKDFGLGVQLVTDLGEQAMHSVESFLGERPPSQAWGHLSQTGSFMLRLPGARHMAAALLLNKSGRKRSGQKVGKAVLHAIAAAR